MPSRVGQAKEAANLNGEKVDNASEEEESEEVESEEEDRQQLAEGPIGASHGAASEPISQVGTQHSLTFLPRSPDVSHIPSVDEMDLYQNIINNVIV